MTDFGDDEDDEFRPQDPFQPAPASSSLAVPDDPPPAEPPPEPEEEPEPSPAELLAPSAADELRRIEHEGPRDAGQRTPPQNIDAEVSVLGALMLDPNVIAEVAPILTGQDFFKEAHRIIYEELAPACEDGRVMDAVVLREALRQKGQLEAAGGAAAIVDILERVPSAAGAAAYAKIVRRCAVLREAIRTGDAIVRLAYENRDEDPVETLAAAGNRLLEVAHGSLPATISCIGAGDLLEMTIERPTPLVGDGKPSPMLSVGQLLLMAGPPKLGKTLAMLDLDCCLAEGGGLWLDQRVWGPCRVLIVLKEGGILLVQDVLSQMTRNMSKEARNRIRIPEVVRDINLSTPRGRMLLKRVIEGEEVQLVHMDPFFRMHRANENDNREMGDIMAFLEELRDVTKVAQSVVHHTSRAVVENSKGKASRSSRGASVVEADADAILTLDHPDQDVDDAAFFAYWDCRRGKAPPNYIAYRGENLRHHVAPLGKRENGKGRRPKKAVSQSDLLVLLQTLGPKTTHQLAALAGSPVKTVQEGLLRLGFAVSSEDTPNGTQWRAAEAPKEPKQSGLPGVS